jgi:hypothetical protein
MLDALRPYLPEIGAPLIATVWFLVGLFFALRERAASKTQKEAKSHRSAA